VLAGVSGQGGRYAVVVQASAYGWPALVQGVPALITALAMWLIDAGHPVFDLP
jgi:hypothetical protein